MRQYLDTFEYILANGYRVDSRAKLASTGEHAGCLTVFAPPRMEFNLADGTLPVVTTKRMPIRTIAEELCWFLRGSNDVHELIELGVHIWDQWMDKTGTVHPSYGKTWRAWRGTFDQINAVLDGIRAAKESGGRDTRTRRLLLTSWDPMSMMHSTNPCGCHTLTQFHVTPHGTLDAHLYQRSGDMFLGVPFNITSYAMLTALFAKLTGLKPGRLVHTLGDAHIYLNHLPKVEEMLTRSPMPLPRLRIADQIKSIVDLSDLSAGDFIVEGYESHPALKGEIAV